MGEGNADMDMDMDMDMVLIVDSAYLEACQLLAGEGCAWTLLVIGLVLWLLGATVAGS